MNFLGIKNIMLKKNIINTVINDEIGG